MYAIRPYVVVNGVAGKKDENLEYGKEKQGSFFLALS